MKAVAWGLAVVLAASMAPAGAEDASLPLCAPEDSDAFLFNPDGDLARRRATLQDWQEQGGRADAFKKLQMGAHFRLGNSHPARLVDADIEKARKLLADAALGGQLVAMASSAELELEHGDPMAAMVWGQLYAHYMQRENPSRTRTYQADLILRAYQSLPRGEATDREIDSLVLDFLDKHGARIDKALAHEDTDADAAKKTCRWANEVYPTRLELEGNRVPLAGGAYTTRRHRLHDPGMAFFWLEITPSGEVKRAMIVETLPGPEAGRGLMRSVMKLRFNPVAEDAPLRMALLPMTFDDRSVRIRN